MSTLYIKAFKESLPVDQINTASMTQPEKNAQVWVLVMGIFKQLLKDNFKYFAILILQLPYDEDCYNTVLVALSN